jgi:hypothetical protein
MTSKYDKVVKEALDRAAEAEKLEKKDVDPNVGGGVDRDKLKEDDFAGPHRSFPIVTPGDVADAVSSLGRAREENRAAIKAQIISIAKRKGEKFVIQLPTAWKDELKKYSPDQERDESGRFSSGGGGSAEKPSGGSAGGKLSAGEAKPGVKVRFTGSHAGLRGASGVITHGVHTGSDGRQSIVVRWENGKSDSVWLHEVSRERVTKSAGDVVKAVKALKDKVERIEDN